LHFVDVNNEKITKKDEKSSKKSLKLDNSIGQVKSSKDKGMYFFLFFFSGGVLYISSVIVLISLVQH